MQHQLESEKLNVIINSLGAELCSVKDKNGLEFLWNAQADVWPRHAPVLFPIVGKLKNNHYLLNGDEYFLSQHGFARDLEFEFKSGNASTCTFEFTATEATKKVYPFDFILQIRYSLHANTLECSYLVKNPSENTLLFSIGAHPGFKVPFTDDETFEDYYLEFEKSDLTQTSLLNGLREGKRQLRLLSNKIALSKTLFDNDALVFENNQINHIVLRSSKSRHSVAMHCKDWPYFGIWSKKDVSRFICLEPWYGIADSTDQGSDFSEKAGIIKLAHKQEFKCSFSIVVN